MEVSPFGFIVVGGVTYYLYQLWKANPPVANSTMRPYNDNYFPTHSYNVLTPQYPGQKMDYEIVERHPNDHSGHGRIVLKTGHDSYVETVEEVLDYIPY